MTINTGILNSGKIGGNASVSNLAGHFGNDVHVTSTASVVDIQGLIERVRVQIQGKLGFPGRDAEIRQKLDQLLGELEKLRERYPAETRRVVSALELVIQELGTEKPNQDFLASSWELTKQALGNMVQLEPAIAVLGEKFAESVSQTLA